MRRAVVVVVTGLVAVSACTSAAPTGTDASRTLERSIRADLRAHPQIPGEAASVRAPGLDVSAAAGYADVATKTPLTAGTPLRIASVTKTFVAVAALRLVEQHRLALDDPIGPALSPQTDALLTAGGYDPGRITLRQLLDHTAGLFDFAAGAAYDHVNTTDPGHHWTRDEQLQFAMDHGEPVGAPGERYLYDDTGYLLVGEIIERATGQSLATAVRDLDRFERLGLTDTWWEDLEPAPAGVPARAHQYVDTTFDNGTLDASSDLYGGGGLVSTVGDLTRFYRALFSGEVFDHDHTLDEMLTVSKPGRGAGAALGIFASRIAGVRCYGHPGYWGTELYHCPSRHLTFALTVNQADESVIDTTPVEHTILGLTR